MRVAASVALCALLIGCATGDRVRDLRVGMSKHEVIERLGRPDGVKRDGDHEALTYVNRRVSMAWADGRADYTMIFENGRLVEYGPGNVRPNDTGFILVAPVGAR